MEENNTAEFQIEVSATYATDEELDRMTRQLLSELRELDVESAELTRSGTAPQGSKGDPITLGSIALVVLPAALPKVFDLVQRWSIRGRGRSIKFKGKGIEFEGTPEDLEKLLALLEKGKKKK
jgi:hypothetical protein